jgi:ATP-dependent Clp protease ATP-binding subunit ClpB
MRFDQMTIKLQEAISEAQAGCEQARHPAIEPEHLLLSLLKDGEGIALALLKKLGVETPKLISELEDRCAKFPKVEGGSSQVYVSNDLKQVLDRAYEQAGHLKDEFLSGEHILLAISQNTKMGAGQLFKAHGIRQEVLLKALLTLRGSQRVTDQNPETKSGGLFRFFPVGPKIIQYSSVNRE